MPKYNSITKGMKIVDIDESGGTYNYYGNIRKNGEYVIMRTNKAGTQYRYKIGDDGYSVAWTDKGTHNYTIPTIG